MESTEVPLVVVWRNYPEEIKKLISNPLGAAIDRLKKAYELGDWEDIKIMVDIFDFIGSDTSLQ